MKKNAFYAVGIQLMLLVTLAGFTGKPNENFTVDAPKSTVKWTAKSIKGGHFGKIQIKNGSFQFDGKSISSGNVLVDMNSISVDDIEDATRNQRLVNHLKNDDFFSSGSFPEAQLVIKNSKAGKAGQLEISGDLTIKGITKPVSFPAKVSIQGNSVEVSGTIPVDRIQYGIKYRSKSALDPSALADKLIYDEFSLDFKVVAAR